MSALTEEINLLENVKPLQQTHSSHFSSLDNNSKLQLNSLLHQPPSLIDILKSRIKKLESEKLELITLFNIQFQTIISDKERLVSENITSRSDQKHEVDQLRDYIFILEEENKKFSNQLSQQIFTNNNDGNTNLHKIISELQYQLQLADQKHNITALALERVTFLEDSSNTAQQEAFQTTKNELYRITRQFEEYKISQQKILENEIRNVQISSDAQVRELTLKNTEILNENKVFQHQVVQLSSEIKKLREMQKTGMKTDQTSNSNNFITKLSHLMEGFHNTSLNNNSCFHNTSLNNNSFDKIQQNNNNNPPDSKIDNTADILNFMDANPEGDDNISTTEMETRLNEMKQKKLQLLAAASFK